MSSPVQIINQALDQISARASITSFDPTDGSQAADIAARNYQPRIDSLFRSAHWNCARTQQTLTLLRARAGTVENPSGALPQPPFPFLYEYACPTRPKMLKARYIVSKLITGVSASDVPLTTGPQTILPAMAGGTPQFLVSSALDDKGNQIKVILTNAPQAELVYTARIDDPDLWDPSFEEAAVMLLAAWMAAPVNGSVSQAARCAQQAKALIMSARVSDGDEGSSSVDMTPDWIKARSGAGRTSISGVGATWDACAFPDGTMF